MFKIIYSILIMFCWNSNTIQAQGAFVIKVNTMLPGSSKDDQFTIPTTGSSYNYNIDIDNNGSIEVSNVTGNYTIAFSNPGIHEIAITGDFPRIYFNNELDKNKIISIEEWGSIIWGSMEKAFYGCNYLSEVNARDLPDLSGVNSISSMFRECPSLVSVTGIENWITTSVSEMNQLFSGAESFNGDLSMWDMSNVTSMFAMFENAQEFDANLSGWDVCNVTNISSIFENARSFNSSIGSWDISNVSSLSEVFKGANSFNRDLSNWNTGHISIFRYMFQGAASFNQSLASWQVGNAIQMHNMLSNCGMSKTNYDATLISWASQNVLNGVILDSDGLLYCQADSVRDYLISNKLWQINGDSEDCLPFVTTWKTDNPGVTNSTSVRIPASTSSFVTYNYDVDWENDGVYDDLNVTGPISHDYGTSGTYQIAIRGEFPTIYFNDEGDKLKILDVNQWGGIDWTGFTNAFKGCANLNVSASDAPDLSEVTSLASMFEGAISFNGNIGHWDVFNVTTIGGIFAGASSFNQNLNIWNTQNITNMSRAFRNATSFNQSLAGWNIISVSNMIEMLSGSGLSRENYDATLIGWYDHVVLGSVSLGANGLYYCTAENVRNDLINIFGWNITGDTKDCSRFLSTWKTDNPGFSSSTSIIIPIAPAILGLTYSYDIDWENDGIFDAIGVTGSASHDYDSPGTYQVAIRGNFPRIYFKDHGDAEKLISVDQWGDLPWDSNMSVAFSGCSNLITVPNILPEGISDISSIFKGASSFNTNISNWNVSMVIYMSGVFEEATSFNQNLNNWNTENVADMNKMFKDATSFNSDISGWNTSSVARMFDMFNGASSFNQNIGAWDVTKVTTMKGMFQNASAFNQNINSWTTTSLNLMNDIFRDASSFNSRLDSLDVSAVTNMRSAFNGASSFNQDISSWETALVTDMSLLFHNAISFNQDIGGWDVSSVETMHSILSGASSFDQNLGTWDVTNVSNLISLDGTAISRQNYDQILIGWSNQNVNNDVTLGASGLEYCLGTSARAQLLTFFSWQINNDTQNCDSSCNTSICTWTGAIGDWHSTPTTNWSISMVPTSCNPIEIPVNKSVTISNTQIGVGLTIEIDQNATFTVENGAQLELGNN